MSARATSLEGLFGLDRHAEADRRGAFRQGFAGLAAAAHASADDPLEGRDPDALARSMRVALDDGLLDDLGWLAPPAAGVALYEIAGALPAGPEKRDLGRRVLGQLYEGNAATFVAIATRMASGSARGLGGSGIRARVALALALPMSAEVAVDPLALALVSRRELVSDWLGSRSVGSLPERRLAARLLERAAREAAARAARGDAGAIHVFRGVARPDQGPPSSRRGREPDTLEGAWATLLADRETLVWRHVASARGLLGASMTDVGDAIRASLALDLSPTEWRRGATSLVSSIALDAERALPEAMRLLKGPLLTRDPGITTAMVWGLGPVIEAEPEAADVLLAAIATAAPLFIAESLIELRGEFPGFGDAAAMQCAQALAGTLGSVNDESVGALARAVVRDLGGRVTGSAARSGEGLRAAIQGAIDAFVEVGTREAHARATAALGVATEMVTELEAIPRAPTGAPIGAAAWTSAALLVRAIDVDLLESGVLRSLMLLNRRPSDGGGGVRSIHDLDEGLGRWLLAVEAEPTRDGAPEHATLHLRQLRALLHLIDGEATEQEDDAERRARVHDRWSMAARRLLSRLAAERPSPLRRAIAATVARALDALVRDGAADPADMLLYAALRVRDPGDLPVLAEASMHPDVSLMLHAYARFVAASAPIAAITEGTASAEDPAILDRPLRALEALVAELPQGASPRIDGLRGALARTARSLAALASATSLRPLSDAGTSPLAELEDALERLRQLTVNARRRCGESPEESSMDAPASAYPLALAAGRAVQLDARSDELGPSIEAAVDRARSSMPRAIADVIAAVLPRIAALPMDDAAQEESPFMLDHEAPFLLQPRREGSLTTTGSWAPEVRFPDWLPTRRTLGGFYVHRQIGGGAAGTVFIVTRIEDRHDPAAERFALKVPDYDATAARSLSETDFLRLFREEAGALLSLPEHPNLARFVTFDAGARPKPILVMELVEGARCDQLLESRLFTMQGALAVLDGVLAGLEAMHEVGVGHLDIKPSNVILRGGKEPVLVDFGLAGRHLRPGCATGSYGAPEIWVGLPDGEEPDALAADMYGFGCFAYEVLTGKTLFEGPSNVALVAAHLTHDGAPPAVQRLVSGRGSGDLGDLLRTCLRKRPGDRSTAGEVRAGLGKAAKKVMGGSWPLGG